MEQWARWSEAVATGRAWSGVFIAVVGLGVGLALRRASLARTRLGAMLFAALGGGVALVRAFDQAWLADDAFISFRYARNLAQGHGLVWNPDERVEGYTNFLWTVVLAAGERVGVPSPYLATVLSVGSVLALVAVGTWCLSRPGWVPLGPVLLAGSLPFVEFTTSGLESASAAVAIAFSALSLRTERLRPFAAWWVLIAALLRPDHVLFFGPLLLVQARAGRRALGHTLAAGAAWSTWWCLRWAWYGEFFPNTFHTKSGGDANWAQGLVYWQDLALSTQLWLCLPLAALVAAWLLRRGERPGAFATYALSGGLLFALYVCRVGGDFMEYRFGLTSFALAGLLLEVTAARAAAHGRWGQVLAASLLLPLGVSAALVRPGEKTWLLARESTFYPVKTWRPLVVDNGSFRQGQALASLPDQGAHAPPIAIGAIGMVGYLTRLPIVDALGLTNAAIARKTVSVRGRPGHEKVASTDELLAEGAQWAIEPGWPELAELTRFRVGGLPVYQLRTSAAMRALTPPPSASGLLTAATSREDALSIDRGVRELFQDDPDTIAAFERHWALVPAGLVRLESGHVVVHGACAPGARLHVCDGQDFVCEHGRFELSTWCEAVSEPVLLEPGSSLAGRVAYLRATGAPALEAVPFDREAELDSPTIVREGDAFPVSAGAVANQQAIVGQRGAGLINGFAKGDAATGRLTVRLPVEAGQPVVLSVRFGGGAQCDTLFLEVAGQRVCGRGDEVLRTAVLLITPTTGELVVTAVDSATGSWGHALIDDLQLWRADAPTRR
jgi:hypothetical protein